jgi:hypothetical protein
MPTEMKSQLLVSVDPKKDYPYKNICDDTLLWRYLPDYKFRNILETNKLWFTRIDVSGQQSTSRIFVRDLAAMASMQPGSR